MERKRDALEKHYILLGEPVSWARVHWGRNHTAYDSQRNVKLITGIEILKQHGTDAMFEGPLEIHFNFYLQPAIKSKLDIELQWHYFKKDLDNMTKFLLDTFNKVLFKDDGQVSSLVLSKRWSRNPRSEIHIKELR